LTNVLYVPSLSYNLFSGAQVTSKGVVCEQKRDRCVIKLENDHPLLFGQKVDNVHYLRCLFVLPAEGQTHLSLARWHARLSHAAVPMLKRMARHQVVKGLGDIHKEPDFKCGVCTAAKMTRAPHPCSTSRAPVQCALPAHRPDVPK
jgi:GAG-pre-integrase domain